MPKTQEKVAEKPTYEIELAVWFDPHHVRHGLLSELPEATQQHLREECAELNIPHHTDEAVYALTCYAANRGKNVPCVMEMALLNVQAQKLYERYKAHAEPWPEGPEGAS